MDDLRTILQRVGRFLTPGVITGLACWWTLTASVAQAARPAPDAQAGQAAYQQYCARCHGELGRGDGVDAKRFYPRPRDLTMGVYKFRSTASGTPPTDDDLFQTITKGLPGSNMPDWQHLDETVRWNLVAYLKSLSPIFEHTPPSPVTVPKDPGPSHADTAKGKALYEKLGCAACHGMAGRANGTSAAGLVDDWGMAIRPANLTQGWAYRGGRDARSVMLRVLTGIDGAGMPSYAEALSPEEAWQLAYYVTSLQELPRWNLVAHAAEAEGALPNSMDDPRWAEAERTDIQLRNTVGAEGAWTAPPTITSVSLRAVYNDAAVAFLVAWDDPTQDQGAPGTVPDRLALLLKLPGSQGDVVTLQAWPYTGAAALEACDWAADRNATVEHFITNFDPIVVKSSDRVVTLPSQSRYADGRWSLMLERPLQPERPSRAAVIRLEEFGSVAVTVWDGGNPRARAVSSWVDLSLGKEASRAP